MQDLSMRVGTGFSPTPGLITERASLHAVVHGG